MNIVLIAHDNKKELMTELCIAYKQVLNKHRLYATQKTGKVVSEGTGLHIYRFLPGNHGGVEQIGRHIAYNNIDMVIFLRNAMDTESDDRNTSYILHLCDEYNIPIATNIATAELLIHGLERGELEWRDIINPHE
ncbi:MAG: methylglyoxal synthase [bacterium]|nr:methylglyoxal synthase [bacterium]